MKKRKKSKLSLMLIALILVLSVGYALLTQQLKIDGISVINKATWKIYWDNVDVNENSVSGDAVTQAAEITNEEKTLVEYSITLSKPRDFYEFTVDAVNEGTIDAMVNVVSNKVYESNDTTERELPSYLTYKVTYGDNIDIDKNHLLKAGEFETYKVRVEFKDIDDPEELPQTDETLKFKFSVDYIQADDQAIERERYTPFIGTISTDGLSVVSFDIDYDKCMEMIGENSEGIDTQALCRGEDVEIEDYTFNIKQEIFYSPSYYEKLGVIKKLKYGTIDSYEIDYEGCKNYLLQDGDTEEEQIELFCTGNTANVFGKEQNLNEIIDEHPEYAGAYDAMGIINATYTMKKPARIITGYDGEVPKNLVIPSEINGTTVTRIEDKAFANKGIEKVTLPDTIEFIGEQAFDDNNLQKVELKKTEVIIGNCAFGEKGTISNNNIPNTYKCIRSFSIKDVEYQFDIGMTWNDWMKSDYYPRDDFLVLSNLSWEHGSIDHGNRYDVKYEYFPNNEYHLRTSSECWAENRGYSCLYGWLSANENYVDIDDMIIRDYKYDYIYTGAL